jgi:integrase
LGRLTPSSNLLASARIYGRQRVQIKQFSYSLHQCVPDQLNLSSESTNIQTVTAHGTSNLYGPTFKQWLTTLPLAARTRNRHLEYTRRIFNWAIEQEWLPDNPLAKAKPFNEPKNVHNGILQVAELEALLRAADPELIPSLAIGAFAGLRNEEIRGLDWSNIKLKRARPIIELPIEVSKTGSRRPVYIQPNLAEWLTPYAKESGSVMPLAQRSGLPSTKKYERLKAEAKLRAKVEMPDNCLGNSFASYYVALCGDENRCAEQMGTSVTMLRKHYRELADPADSPTYFKISPNPDRPVRTFTLPVVQEVTHPPVSIDYFPRDIQELYLNKMQTDAQLPDPSRPSDLLQVNPFVQTSWD